MEKEGEEEEKMEKEEKEKKNGIKTLRTLVHQNTPLKECIAKPEIERKCKLNFYVIMHIGSIMKIILHSSITYKNLKNTLHLE